MLIEISPGRWLNADQVLELKPGEGTYQGVMIAAMSDGTAAYLNSKECAAFVSAIRLTGAIALADVETLDTPD